MSLQLLALSLALGFSVALVAWMLLNSLREVQEAAEEQSESYSENPLFRATLPFIQHAGRHIQHVHVVKGLRRSISDMLLYSGKGLSITADEFMGYMLVWGVLGIGLAGYLHIMMDGVDPYLALCAVLLTAFVPYAQLSAAARLRQKLIRRMLPYTLDLLCLAVEAGMDFTAALNRIGENLKKHPFREELRQLTRDISMGKTRAEALRDMEKRIGIEELTTVVSALVQADELGSSLGPALRIQSRELQRIRFQRAEKKAMQAPVLMLIPLVLFIIPLVFMIIITPIALKVREQFM